MEANELINCACVKMSSLEVRTPIQLQLRRFVLTKPIYMPLPKLEILMVVSPKLCQYGLLLREIMPDWCNTT